MRVVNGPDLVDLAYFYLAYMPNGQAFAGRWLVNGLGRVRLKGKTLAHNPAYLFV